MTGLELGTPRVQDPLFSQPYDCILAADGSPWLEYHRTGGGYLLRYPGRADFHLAADGWDIQAWPVPGASEATLLHLYRNQVRPLALSRQGRLVLHASAVDLGGRGIAFGGPSGHGKSTLAAAFARQGAGFLCDDGLLLDVEDSAIRVEPADPSLRLWEDSLEALAIPPETLAPPLDYTPKGRLLAGAVLPHCTEPRPLAALFLLGDDEADTRIQPVPPAEALRALLRLITVLDRDARDVLAAHFEALSRMVRQVEVLRLAYPRRYEALPGVLGAVAACVSGPRRGA